MRRGKWDPTFAGLKDLADKLEPGEVVELVRGVDYDCLDTTAQVYLCQRAEARTGVAWRVERGEGRLYLTRK